ncbi:hypothetical protein ACGFYV_25685 [Streptomyces sp. NPDC048297]|uniref:hypothetical protein n=1 Tax=Streptomyces sp. NPDC048297 TaxID=3365531 RepID=UPI003714903F
MHMYLVAGAWLVVALAAAGGIAAIATDWVPPWIRRRVVRPRLWGYGTLTMTLGLTLLLLLGPFEDAGFGAVGFFGYCGLFLAGGIMQALSQRPGGGPTKSAS